MVFELASTNLVIELGIILIVLMGWQFAAAEYVGGMLMVIFIALIFRFTLTSKLVSMAKAHAQKGLAGRMEGHAAMDMSVSGGSFFAKLFSGKGFLPILDIYRKYHGWKVMWYTLATFYVTMAAAGYVVEFLFGALGIIPQNRNVVTITEGIQWNYTTILNIIFLVLAAVLVIRFIRTGGLPMLRMMNTSEHEMTHHEMS